MRADPCFTADVLRLDPEYETERIVSAIRHQVAEVLRRKGSVVAMSGGIDSSVVAALLVKALGKEHVKGLLMPEAESSADTLRLSQLAASHLGIETIVEDITPTLHAVGCYARRDQAIRSVVPEFGPGYACKIVLPDLLAQDSYRLFSVVVQSPSGQVVKARLTLDSYRGIVAATNFKQRVRKMMEYYHADRLHFAVAGTPNLLEYDQGFFVKNGDGAADLKPIAHLYKTQVYQLAGYLEIPEEIVARPPSTDTYSLHQTQEEFFFSIPYQQFDLCLYGKNHDVPVSQVAAACGLSPENVERVFRDIDAKRKATRYLHLRPLLVRETDAVLVGGE